MSQNNICLYKCDNVGTEMSHEYYIASKALNASVFSGKPTLDNQVYIRYFPL